jgi:hypothetical protein
MAWRRVLLVGVALATLGGCTPGEAGGGGEAGRPATSSPPAASAAVAPSPVDVGCAAPVRTGQLPSWARAGFSGDARAVHVLGQRGDIVAVLFGHPLRQPPDAGRNNKILWVSRVSVVPGDPLVIEARLPATGATVSREVPGGPGPSIIDLPRAGCWELTLTWSGHRDAMALEYLPPGAG